MNTPDVTPIQYGAIGTLVAGITAAAAVVDNVTVLCTIIVSLAVVTIAAMFADALIRSGRAGVAEASVYADTAQSSDIAQGADAGEQ